MFDRQELLAFLDQATWVTLNDYEAQLLFTRTGLSPHEVAERVEALIITQGAKGSTIYMAKKRLDIPVAAPRAMRDPTGCGDAYRAGLLYGIAQGVDWETTGRIASLMGTIKIEHHGTQNHSFAPAEFEARFSESFGYAL
jgi:adenosine kinase